MAANSCEGGSVRDPFNSRSDRCDVPLSLFETVGSIHLILVAFDALYFILLAWCCRSNRRRFLHCSLIAFGFVLELPAAVHLAFSKDPLLKQICFVVLHALGNASMFCACTAYMHEWAISEVLIPAIHPNNNQACIEHRRQARRSKIALVWI